MCEQRELQKNPFGGCSSTRQERLGRRFRVTRYVLNILFVGLFIIGVAPKIGWADENFFQIINDMTNPVSSDFTPDSGYAVYVSYEGKKFLMDTGVGEASLIHNLKAAGITLDDLDFVFLSHRHFDHVGGLGYVRSKRPTLPIYIPPGRGFVNPAGLKEVKDHLMVSPNIYLIRTHNDGGFAGIADELSLLIKTKKGPYLLTACTHTGFFKILEEAKRVAGENIFFHTGGTQLNGASRSKIETHVGKLKTLNVTQISPSHCSSADRVQKSFKMVFGTNYLASRLGQKVPLEPGLQ